MKKRYQTGVIGILLLLLLAVSGCSKKEEKIAPESAAENVTETEKQSEAENPAEADPMAETENPADTKEPEDTGDGAEAGETSDLTTLPGTYPRNFVFSSGAGAWGTFLTLEADGSFTGGYNDSDMGDSGEGYPHGKHYYCEFQGKFRDFKKIDENTFSMTLEDLTFEPEAGLEEIRDEILYVGSEPYGLESGKEFIFYTPQISVLDLSEEFLSWWPNRYEWDGETQKALGCYGILNQETGAGFFSDVVCTACGGDISPQTGVCGTCGLTQE
ncbi:MAG: hypothetical protein HFI19_13955 [Lachnospiraceae bacterium]|jgi:hypothetical protein|nr:hypothetical protein [Lachnospiraceae bacterium]